MKKHRAIYKGFSAKIRGFLNEIGNFSDMKAMNYFLELWKNPYVKKTVKGSLIVFLMTMIASILGYAVRIILSRQLSLEEFGAFYAVFTFVTFFTIFKDLGLTRSLIKFLPEFKIKKDFIKIKSIILYVFLTNLISALIWVSIWFFLSHYLSLYYFKSLVAEQILYYLSIYFVMSIFSDVFSVTCLGFQKNFLYSLKLVLINIFVLIGLFIFKSQGVFAPAISYILAVILSGIIYGFLLIKTYKSLKSNRIIISRGLFKKLFFFGIPLTLMNFGFIIIGYVDVLMLTFFRSLEEVGIYSVVLPTAILFSTIGSSIGLVLLPIVSEMLANKNRKKVMIGVRLINKLLIFITIPLAILIMIFSKLIITVLFGNIFVMGDAAFKILIVGSIFYTFVLINSNVIVANGDTAYVSKLILSAAVLNFILNLFMIPLFGMEGAAIVTTFSYFVICVAMIKKIFINSIN